MSDPANTCGRCTHWGKPLDSRDEFRDCTAITHDSYTTSSMPEHTESAWIAVCDADDDFEYMTATLRTRADFGCVMFDRKE